MVEINFNAEQLELELIYLHRKWGGSRSAIELATCWEKEYFSESKEVSRLRMLLILRPGIIELIKKIEAMNFECLLDRIKLLENKLASDKKIIC